MKTSSLLVSLPDRTSHIHKWASPLVCVRLSWLLLLAALAYTPLASAQIIGAQDLFNYTTSNITGHALTMGTGTWSTWYSTNSNISTNATDALMSLNGGVPGGGGQAIANFPFTPSANTIYTLTTTLRYSPLGTGYSGFGAVGFSNVLNGGGNKSQNNAPWIALWAQATGSSNPSTQYCTGTSVILTGTLAAANYSAPIVTTVTWNTQTGVTQTFINGNLTYTGTTGVPSGQYYAFLQGFLTGTCVNFSDVTLSSEAISYSSIAMQDNFTYTSSSLNGCTPTTVMGSGWSAKWVTSLSNGTISTDGTQALMSTNGGTPGVGSVTANFPFQVNPNTFYTLRAAFNYSLMGASYDCWGGLGFSNSSGTNMAPWMFIRPQAVVTDNPGTGFCLNNSWIGSGGVCAAANYSAPITATITWNTATGVVCYYIDDLLQSTGTSSVLPNGTFNAFFQGFKTGSVVNVKTISLTAQPISQMSEVWLSPHIDTNSFSAIIESGTTSCGWATARSHTQVWSIYDNKLNDNTVMTATQRITFFNYLIAHNIKLAICIQPLVHTTNTCTNYEGYADPSVHTNAIAAIQTAIAGCSNPTWKPSYVALDSPLADCENTGTCNMSIPTAASQTAISIGYFTSAWSGLQVVEYDGVDSFPSADVTSWFTAMSNNGRPINAVIDDFSWFLGWTDRLQTAQNLCAASGVAFGNFWDGFAGVAGGNTNGNTPQFMLGEKINLQCLNASACAVPTRLEVASWGDPDPCDAMVPETSGSTLSNALDMALTSPYVLQTPPVALYRVWIAAGVTTYTSIYSDYLNLMAQGGKNFGPLGGIEPNPNIGGIQGLVQIYRYYNASKNYYALSLSTNDSTLNANGFLMQTSLGYVFPCSTGMAAGGVPLYEFYNPTTDQYSYTTNSTVPNGFVGDGVKAYLLPDFYHHGWDSADGVPY